MENYNEDADAATAADNDDDSMLNKFIIPKCLAIKQHVFWISLILLILITFLAFNIIRLHTTLSSALLMLSILCLSIYATYLTYVMPSPSVCKKK